MADKTVINNPPSQQQREGNGGGAGWAVAIIIIIAVILFFVYGLPRFRDGNDTNINLPENIDVQPNQP